LVLEIDGSMGEGGGQILRVSVALSTILGKPIRIDNIRRRRSPPGLRPQHKTAVAALARMSNAAVKGLTIGSTRLTFAPGKLTGGRCFFDTGTAGSVSLILQSLLPVMALSTRRFHVEVCGGTNNPLAPPVDYLQGVLLPTVSQMGLKASIQLLKRGFYPRGGGVVRAEVEPVEQLTPLTLTEYKATQQIAGVSYSSRLPCHIVERMAESARKTLAAAGHQDVQIRLECLQPPDGRCARDPGTGILLVAHLLPHGVLGSDSLGQLGKPAEQVGWEAASNLTQQLAVASPVDKFLGDQLIIYMALASGVSTIRVSELTSHTVTCMAVSQMIAGVQFNVAGRQGTPATITCGGRR
jgi:RNA 3'-terminal phosphate cyclase (ATP)